ncbi:MULTISPECIES: IS481-like element ISRhsp3 family transposase [Cereibacter]|uniref:IS481-like element ISRhsp3 family transposase n=1 Tax=Cereibacter TaxID=1653176 RepID=UPI0000664F26|nr:MULTISPECIES: IS481-like element ISRhsp3 family transposase [Cereibacter]ABN78290.1 Integrase, catalytic region [Cereibacter sphaeroides ATCC 17029]AZB56206.1 IS481-like element ISRhsp3 family transposase [Cereibacter sphaeroides]AZB60461.1 IS481-like element ISRhsp3 family transposase [Cereibacter sphaeroides]EGJ19712.1 integrase catalytic subunit [Cereibacter sphaeroides WS8N]EGJ21650.1 integrase catalytic subunit [Cereibacter sphaeroides WS8N]
MDQSTKAPKARKRDPDTKLAQHRLSVLELAKELGNVAEACRQRGLDRTSFYEWKRRFQTQGFEGLKDLPPIHKSHPQSTPPETVARIKTLALAHPAYGCNRFEAMLALEGIRVSSITIQKILNENGLGTKSDRWLALEQANAEKRIELTAEQAAFIEKLNPCFRERHVESSAPGELLSADTFFVGALKGIGRVYLHAVVDTFGSYAFGFLHVSKQPEAAVAVLHNDVLPFYRNLDLPVGAVLTDNGREFCGTERHPYELYLDLNGIEHRRTRVRTPKTNGFVERFNGTILDEFFRVAMRDNFYESVEALQADLDAWLVHYNTERPHLGYRNMGRRPVETVMSFVSQEG